MIYIYNTLTKEKEPLKTIDPKKIRLYVCGLTVYDDCHIGHGRLFIWFDTFVRYLRSVGYEVTYVRNITDIDDKIIKRSKELGIDWKDLTLQVIDSMHNDEKNLNIISPNFEPKVTEHIPEIIEMIQTLVDKGFAYQAQNGDVYYSVEKFDSYGELSHQDIESLCSGARVESNEDKNNPLDFVLWKTAKPGEPSWSSPWGEGRPGWHIECSAMAKKYLGSHFDIHGGGSDLQFPHHQNEVAQSEAANDCKLANYWMHIGFVQSNQEKMSKSLGNFFTLKKIFAKYNPEVLRYFVLNSHYRSPVNFSFENMDLAASALRRFYITLREYPVEKEEEKIDIKNEIYKKFHEAMSDDFNTPRAISYLFDLVREINQLRDNERIDEAKKLCVLLRKLAGSLGLLQEDPNEFLKSGTDIDRDVVETLIEDRNKARKEKDWTKSDKIRDELTAMGISLEDTPNGTLWSTVKSDK